MGRDFPVVLAGAGATRDLGTHLRVARITDDPVTAAEELAETGRPAMAGG